MNSISWGRLEVLSRAQVSRPRNDFGSPELRPLAGTDAPVEELGKLRERVGRLGEGGDAMEEEEAADGGEGVVDWG